MNLIDYNLNMQMRFIFFQDPTTAYIFDSGAYMIKAGNSNFNGPW